VLVRHGAIDLHFIGGGTDSPVRALVAEIFSVDPPSVAARRPISEELRTATGS
jgi:hypothetical protein